MDYSGQEKRKSKRIDQPFTVRFQPRSHFGDPWDLVLIRDISNGGILFNHDRDLPAGTALNLKISIGLDEPPIECAGKVLRCRMLGQSKIFEAGVQFEAMDAKKKERIDAAVEKFEIRKAKEVGKKEGEGSS